MKRFITALAIVAAISACSDIAATAKTPESRNDSIVNQIKLKGLRTQKEKLENEIKVQDAKRNNNLSGVAPETMEEINDRQDSVCLNLRSQLVDVILEIKENSPEIESATLMQLYGTMLNNNQTPPTKK